MLQHSLLNTLKTLNRPAHIQVSKTLGNLSFSIRSSNDSALSEHYQYMQEYSNYNFNSKYKTWFELDHKEQFRFMNSYLNKHELMSRSKSASRSINQMDNQNKDVNFMFFHLYEGLKTQADSTQQAEAVFKDDIFDLLYEKE
ncbi:hypothetical protein BN7_3709 [Wickerhamomyces ciferrii]|uniref:Uncharacterized protein n=1 Tax=Wickerhamomyces ciferrii (strain ATCC 14091 / BCRC 22168 / CBS 111 / JCM 3599 / NBRC 0793 / NRRL Y-1031 F-60-10) TaxID=1206466 RepID=K0KMD9_WICCF|nr:uncharacterized protein BN7_3709 [Wickerhamomyces ciferrii]CCH44151.1 hypothetical protein BN7_3709 [Wickerhamomyces ciferrii]